MDWVHASPTKDPARALDGIVRFVTNEYPWSFAKGHTDRPPHLRSTYWCAGLLGGCCSIVLLAPAPAAAVGRDARTAPVAAGLSASNGGAPFNGDGRLLTTISPNRDGLRDK